MSGLTTPPQGGQYVPGYTAPPGNPYSMTPTPVDTGQGTLGVAFQTGAPLMPVDLTGPGRPVFRDLALSQGQQSWSPQLTNLVSLRGHGVYQFTGTVMQRLWNFAKTKLDNGPA